MKKYLDLANMHILELSEELAKYKKDKMKLRFSFAAKEQTNTSLVKKNRRHIARIKTAVSNLKVNRADILS